FSHRRLVMLAAILRGAEGNGDGGKSLRRTLSRVDASVVARTATVLSCADELTRRLAAAGTVSCAVRGRKAVLRAPVPAGGWLAQIAKRVLADSGYTLTLETVTP